MVLLPAGAMLGKALFDKMSRNGPQQIVRSSRVMSNLAAKDNWKPRPRARAVNPFAKEEVLNRLGGTGIRRLSTKQPTEDSSQNITDWVPVYRYPGIRYCQLLARAKFVQTLASVAYLPYSSYEYYNGAISPTWFYTTAALAIAAPTVLAIFSSYINRLVGVISISGDNEWVRIGYLTFWGRRKNKLIQIEDLLPLSETGVNEKDKLVKLGFYSDGRATYISLILNFRGDCVFLPTYNCEILDQGRAEIIFGSTKVFDNKQKKE